MFTLEETEKALSQAKKWMLEHPDFEPKFEKVFNVILNADEETKNMTAEVMKAGDIDTESPAFNFSQYAVGVLKYKTEVAVEETKEVEVIFNGGDPLPGCPENFEEANKWAENANKDKDDFHEPNWAFDCGFKLDFDGPIISISGRFYPPKTHYGEGWDGAITVIIMGKELSREKIQAESLSELKAKAEKFVKELASKLNV